MKDKKRIFIDSNIFLYAFNDSDISKYKKAAKIIIDNYHNYIISLQVINEVSNNMLKKLFFTNNEIKEFIRDSYKRFEVKNITKKIFIDACDIRDNYNISYYDSLIISTAINANCDYLYSEDMQHQQNISNKLTIINPFKS